jgi:hypothetical protein
MAWAGSLLVLVHAGIHFNSILAWLAVLAMLINVASGLTGKFLLERSRRRLDEARQRMRSFGPHGRAEVRAQLLGQPDLRCRQAVALGALPDHAGLCRAGTGAHRGRVPVLGLEMKGRWLWIVIGANLMVLVALAFIYPHLMVAPGPLMVGHAELSTDCFACHTPLRGAKAERCIACHACRHRSAHHPRRRRRQRQAGEGRSTRN